MAADSGPTAAASEKHLRISMNKTIQHFVFTHVILGKQKAHVPLTSGQRRAHEPLTRGRQHVWGACAQAPDTTSGM